MGLELLLRWLQEHNVTLHDRIFVIQQHNSEISVISSPDKPIFHPDRAVAVIPKSAILSVRTCSLAPQIPWYPYGHEAILVLSLALYSEQLLGDHSQWHGYLQSLPGTAVPIARLWGYADAFRDLDADAAACWLHGTEVQRELQSDEGVQLKDEIDHFYQSEAHPLLISANLEPTLAGFLHAYSLVCSRAFLVDAYHGLSMVPVADAFNHAHENHVQLASEYDVCPACGSLSECPHDRDDEMATDAEDSALVPPSIDPTDTVDMVTVCSIPPGVEVFNTYGAVLGNAALLARYGFMLDGSETDTVTFGWPGSSLDLLQRDGGTGWERTYGAVRNSARDIISGSSLIYVPYSEPENSPVLAINSDGQVSVALFTWAIMHAHAIPEAPELQLTGVTVQREDEDSAVMVRRVCANLMQFEMLRNVPFEYEDAGVDARRREPETVIDLYRAANTLQRLCEARAGNMGAEQFRGQSTTVLYDFLDTLPAERTKTRLALEYFLGERTILSACAAAWEEMKGIISPDPRSSRIE